METRRRPEDVRRSLGRGFLGQKSHSTSERIWGWCDMRGGVPKEGGVITLPLATWIKFADFVLHVHSLHYKKYIPPKVQLSLNNNFCPDDMGRIGTLLNPNPVLTGVGCSSEKEEPISSVTSVAGEIMKNSLLGAPLEFQAS
ncbi:E3 ubiquitin-protein ligase BOI [Abeliophyllum distichum]|uniref:E3 ubiquitin-protein ligase BOI n=1 Tax=Abeliophyllum distichum TaxID=126358 RepID=A0ABD1RW47_9LAMI